MYRGYIILYLSECAFGTATNEINIIIIFCWPAAIICHTLKQNRVEGNAPFLLIQCGCRFKIMPQ